MKKLISSCLALLFVVQANAQSEAERPFPAMEVHTRPISLLQGVITVGSEIRLNNISSFLIDGGAGRSLVDNRYLTTFMIGGRLYLKKEDLSGTYVTFRHRSRFYKDEDIFGSGNNYGANTNFMIGSKIIFEQVSFAGEVGLGRQSYAGVPVLLPTWAVTVGYRFKGK